MHASRLAANDTEPGEVIVGHCSMLPVFGALAKSYWEGVRSKEVLND